MKLFYKTRKEQRAAQTINGKKVDMGQDAPQGRRWAIDYKANFKK